MLLQSWTTRYLRILLLCWNWRGDHVWRENCCTSIWNITNLQCIQAVRELILTNELGHTSFQIFSFNFQFFVRYFGYYKVFQWTRELLTATDSLIYIFCVVHLVCCFPLFSMCYLYIHFVARWFVIFVCLLVNSLFFRCLQYFICFACPS